MKQYNKTIIACRSIKTELEKVHNNQKDIKLVFVPQFLHRNPEKLTNRLQETIDKEAEFTNNIVLGYGLCSNGTAGLKAPETGLIIPKVHDCITLYLGGEKSYTRLFYQYPGTYFLTPNWIDNKNDPLGLVQYEYKQRVGYDMAKEAMETEIKNYKYIAFINNNSENTNYYKERTKENAEFFDKEYIEFEGSVDFLTKIIEGPYDNEDFVWVKPNEFSKQSQFLK